MACIYSQHLKDNYAPHVLTSRRHGHVYYACPSDYFTRSHKLPTFINYKDSWQGASLFEVKRPEESKKPWDYYKLRATIPAAEAFRPIGEGGCPLVTKTN